MMNRLSPTTSKSNRSLHRVMVEINTELTKVHKKIAPHIIVENYSAASDYVSQFVSYTTIWNIKFVYNLESPEVALMQIMHLKHILACEPETSFIDQRAILQEMTKLFLQYSPYSSELISKRKKKFQDYIQQCL